MRGSKLKFLDYWLFVPFIILCAIGMVMVYSASSDIAVQNGGTATGYLVKQAIFIFLGLIVMFFTFKVNVVKLRHQVILTPIYYVVLGMLGFVYVFGATVNGAKGWINLGFMSIQPAEIAKLAIIIFMADRLTDYQRISANRFEMSIRGREYNWSTSLMAMWGRVMLLVAIIAIMPDTGGAAICLSIILIMWLASGINWKGGVSLILIGVGALLIGLGPIAHHVANSGNAGGYRFARFIAFANPFGTAKGAGSQLVNSYYAISHGGLFGVGLGNSIQKMGYLPEPNTDFILAIIAEEMGVLFVMLILALLGIIIARTVYIGVRSKSAYESLICYGVATFMSVETFFNVGGVTGLVPITGVTFPFISYGGSSMLVLCASLGLVINISSQQKRLKVVK